MNEKLNLSAPWEIFFCELKALFGADDSVHLIRNDDEKEIKLLVDGTEKAEALRELLPAEKVFGNVTLKINVIPSNVTATSMIDLFRKAFEGNPAVRFIGNGSGPISSDYNYIAFEPEVVQFFADDLGNVGGYKTMLFRDVAKDVLGDYPGIYYSTALKTN